MEAIDFDERNVLIAEHQEEYQTLPAHCANGEQTFCWQLSEHDRDNLNASGGKIWHTVLTRGKPLQPLRLSTEKPDLPLAGELGSGEMERDAEQAKMFLSLALFAFGKKSLTINAKMHEDFAKSNQVLMFDATKEGLVARLVPLSVAKALAAQQAQKEKSAIVGLDGKPMEGGAE